MVDWENKVNWAAFKDGKFFVRAWDKEVCQEFLECCDKRGIKWQDGKKATEYNPFEVESGLVYALEFFVEKDGLSLRYEEFNTGLCENKQKPGEIKLKNLRKDDGRLKVRKDTTGEIFTFVEYADDGKVLVYDKNGAFLLLYFYEVKVIT